MWVRSLKIIEDGTIRKLGYAFSYLQMAASLAVCEISIVKEWCDLENWVLTQFSRSHHSFNVIENGAVR